MNSRKKKQLIYGSGFAVIFAAILISAIYFSFKAEENCFDKIQNQNETGVDCGGVCAASCEQKNAQPLKVNWIKNIKVDDNSVILLAEIKNPNFSYGADDFTYDFNISDISGVEIENISEHSFIYPGETKYLFEILDIRQSKLQNKLFAKELAFSQYSWKSGNNFKKPDIQLNNFKTETSGSGSDFLYPLVVSGVVKNTDIVKVSKVILSAFVYGNDGEIAGVSKTELENLNPIDEKKFMIIFPKNIDAGLINQNATKVFVDAIR